MASVQDAVDVEAVGTRFLAGICKQDWEEVVSCFMPDVRFRALIPSAVHEGVGASVAVGHLRGWLGDADQLVLLSSDAEPMQGRLAIR